MESKTSREGDSRRFPPAGDFGVLVQCEGFRCLAFRDRDGKWRDYYGGTILRGRIEMVDPLPESGRTSDSE